MTAPSKAQIKAAAKAMADMWAIKSTAKPTMFEGLAKAALTAAAEVERLCDCYFPRREDCDAKLVAATIERCAQVADNMAYVEACADVTYAGRIAGAPYRKVAAAIRALATTAESR